MATAEFIKTQNGLMYFTDEDRSSMKRVGKIGDVIRGKFSAPRSGKFHRKCRVLQETIFEHQSKIAEYEAFREELKLLTGLYTWEISPFDGSKYPKTKSTAYDKMDEVEHEKWYQKLIDFAIQDVSIFKGKSDAEANAFVDSIIGGFA